MPDKPGQHRARTTSVRSSDPFDGEYDVDKFYRRMQAEQNLPFGIIAGTVAALLGAAFWALIAMGLRIQSGWVAMVIGILVGNAVRFFGKGVTLSFPIAAAALAVLGCVLGKLLSAAAFYAFENQREVGGVFLDLLSEPQATFAALKYMTTPLDGLFYVVAILVAAILAFRRAVFNQD